MPSRIGENLRSLKKTRYKGPGLHLGCGPLKFQRALQLEPWLKTERSPVKVPQRTPWSEATGETIELKPVQAAGGCLNLKDLRCHLNRTLIKFPKV